MANIRKVIEKNRLSDKKSETNEKSTAKTTIIIVIVMLLLAYGITNLIYYFNMKSAIIDEVKQYNINASTIFNMPEKEYYVMIYDKKGTDAIVLNSIIDNYRNKKKSVIYEVDLSKEYNKSIVSTIPNLTVSNSSELKVTSSTLIKVKEGINEQYFESVLIIEKELNK